MITLETIEGWDVRYSEDSTAIHVTPDGIELYYTIRGGGPWLTLITSPLVPSTIWRNFTGRLEETHSILTYDLRNQGVSSRGPGDIQAHLRDLLSLLDRLGVEQTAVVGVSLSTVLAREMAATAPDMVSHLILCGSVISPWGSRRRHYYTESLLAALDAGGPGAVFDAMFPMMLSDRALAAIDSAAYRALRDRFLALNSASSLRPNLEGTLTTDDDPVRLAAISSPTLVVSGDQDSFCSPAAMSATAEVIGAETSVAVLDSCAHMSYMEATAAFEDCLMDFLLPASTAAA